MGSILDRFKKDVFANRLVRSTEARQWLYNKAQSLRFSKADIFKIGSVNNIFIGQMFFFAYDPKTKEILPYYDRFPLVIPIEMYSDGFLGLNLHYLEPGMRVVLLDRLAEYATNKNYDNKMKLRLSYEIVSEASKLQIAQPCIKRYLFSHVRSKFVPIDPMEWDMAAFLPVESFVGASKERIWKESRTKF